MNEADPIQVVTILASPAAVVALVNIAKDLGLPSKFAPAMAVVFGVGIMLGAKYVEEGLWSAISRGVVLALAASGVRDLTAQTPPEDRAIYQAVNPDAPKL